MEGKALSVALASLLLMSAPAVYAAAGDTPVQQPGARDADAQEVIHHAVGAVQRAKADARFEALIRQSKGIVIIPNLVKGAAVIGGEGGQGVLLAHRHEQWSDPAFIAAGGFSVGGQIGGEAGPVVMLLMSDKAVADFTQRDNFSLKGDADLTVVHYSKQAEGGFGGGDVVLWSGETGAFVGASLTAADFRANGERDAHFYGQRVTTGQIISGVVHNPESDALRNSLPL